MPAAASATSSCAAPSAASRCAPPTSTCCPVPVQPAELLPGRQDLAGARVAYRDRLDRTAVRDVEDDLLGSDRIGRWPGGALDDPEVTRRGGRAQPGSDTPAGIDA